LLKWLQCNSLFTQAGRKLHVRNKYVPGDNMAIMILKMIKHDFYNITNNKNFMIWDYTRRGGNGKTLMRVLYHPIPTPNVALSSQD